MNVLIATLGGTWAVVPEIIGFTNPDDLPLYHDRPEIASLRRRHDIEAVDEVWVVTTADEKIVEARQLLAAWQRHVPHPRIRCFWPEGLEDLQTAADVRRMAELIHRLVLRAHERTGGEVWLSLAGGRKTMSADLQRAGQTFGCRAMLHVVERAFVKLAPADLTPANAPNHGDRFTPIVVSGRQLGSEAVRLEWEKLLPLADLPGSGAVSCGNLDDAPLLAKLEDIQRRSDALLVNYRLQLSGDEPLGNFRALYALPPRTVEALKHTVIGRDPARRAEELAWLRELPKAELHCHLGGILSPAEMIEVAAAEADRVHEHRKRLPQLAADLAALERHIAAGDEIAIDRWLGGDGFKGLRQRWPEVPEPLGVCAFLLAFQGHEDLLAAVIYGDWRDPARLHRIGIDAYERLGDLQGSGLLQSRATLGAALAVLGRQCREHNVSYLELRCSPLNYIRGGLTDRQVVTTLLDGLDAIGDCDIRLIFIASRHGDPSRIEEHVNLARRLLETSPRFARRFVGFDLAGAEHAGNPARFRKRFRPLHERVVRITIHAGEGEAVRNVWEAVYELSADRIGHGLTLGDDPQLLGRFRDRGIAIEMCPSSNFQIVGFRDHLLGVGDRPYPLGDYLRQGLRVTVNTDDPGISRTDLSHEYHKAAAMTPGGLSRWQILQLLRNGFRAAFCSHEDRQRLLVAAERQVFRHLTR